MTQALDEIAPGERFAVGENWRRFFDSVTPESITTAQSSLVQMLGVETPWQIIPRHRLWQRAVLIGRALTNASRDLAETGSSDLSGV